MAGSRCSSTATTNARFLRRRRRVRGTADADHGERGAVRLPALPTYADPSPRAVGRRAAEAAGQQARFWDELLFAHQDRLTPGDLIGYASTLRLDLRRLAVDLETHAHAPRVREDFLSGVRSGVNGTPTFFTNGVRHNGGSAAGSLVEALRMTA